MPELVNLKGPWAFASNGEVMDKAIAQSDATKDTVDDYLDTFSGYVEDWKGDAQKALDAVAALASAGFIVENTPPLFNVSFDPDRPDRPTHADAPSPNDILFNAIGTPDYMAVPTVVVGDVPEFAPSILALDIPPPPVAAQIKDPGDVPVLEPVLNPVAPTLTIAEFDPSVLATITIPEFIFPELPEFTAAAPTLDDSAVPTGAFVWSVPAINIGVREEIIAELKRKFKGGTGIHPAVEQALFSRAREREDVTALKATQEIINTWAGRGFTMPPGMAAAQVAATQFQNQMQVNALLREIVVKAAEWELANLKDATTQGLVLEGELIKEFDILARVTLDAAKYTFDSRVSLYNSIVAAFNAKSQAYNVAAMVYKVKIEAALQKLEEFKARVQGEIAKGEINKVLIEAYKAGISGVQARVDLYKAQVQAASTAVDSNKARVESYKAEVEAYGERVKADKTRFDVYSARIAAEGTKANILEAEARVFASRVSAHESEVRAQSAAVSAAVSQNENLVRQYVAAIDAEKARVAAEVSTSQNQIELFKADIQRFVADVQAGTETYKADIQLLAAQVQGNVAQNELQYKRYTDQMNRLVEQMKLKSDQVKAIAQLYSQLTSGALSAMHISESVSSSASIGASAGTSTSDATSRAYSESQGLNESLSKQVSN